MSGPYRIVAKAPKGAVTYTRRSAKDAAKLAIEMFGLGLKTVYILDVQDQRYSLAQFARVVASEGGAEA